MTRPSEVSLKYLTHIHTGRNTQRIEHDLYRRTIFEIRHVLVRQNARDHALVTVTASHFVAHTQLALHGDIDFDQLDHTRRELVALRQLVFPLVDDFLEHVNLSRGHLLDLVNLLIHARIFVVVLNALQVPRGNALDGVAIENRALGEQALIGALVVQVSLHLLAAENVLQTLQPLVSKNSNLVGKVLFELCHLRTFDGLRPLVFFLALAGEDLHIHDHAFNSRRAVERCVANVPGFFAEDRA